MIKKSLKVLRGGLLDSSGTSRKIFISSYVTNTRLMGVLGMYTHWELPDNGTYRDFHQFFYFDAEEYGFETYDSVLGNSPDRVTEIENSLIGGLGGEKISLTQREAQFLLQDYMKLNSVEDMPLPDKYDEYSFLLAEKIHLAEPESYILMGKQCIGLDSPYEVINYFLMRCFCRDFAIADYLSAHKLSLDLFPSLKRSTFCKNTIDAGKTRGEYLCESLVEAGDSYYLIITNLTLEGLLVSKYERVSCFKVSPAEAAMMLSRSEYVSVYEMLCDPDEFTKSTSKLASTALVTSQDQGTLFMMFHEHNKHVNKKEYRINEDILGMYYVSNSGQLITASYAQEEIRKLEIDLSTSTLGRKLIPVGKYEFQEPVLYEYIQSGFDDFELFVEAIKTEE